MVMGNKKTIKMKIKTLLLLGLVLTVVSASSQTFRIDSTFQTDYNFRAIKPWSLTQGSIAKIVVLKDQSIIVGGVFSDPNFDQSSIVKLDKYGQVINSFMYHKYEYWMWTFDTLGTSIYAVDNHRVKKFDASTCELNPEFSINFGMGEFTSSICTLNDGDFFVAGLKLDTGGIKLVTKVKPDGISDSTFNHNTNGLVLNYHRYDSQRLIVEGTFTTYDNISVNDFIRVYNDGQIDTSFDCSGIWGSINDMHVEEDGKAILCGSFYLFGNSTRIAMIRIMPDGSLDSTFNNFNNVTALIRPNFESPYRDTLSFELSTICATEDHKYIIGGQFSHYQNYFRNSLALIDSNGFLDTLAFTGSGIDTCLTGWPYLGVRDIVAAGDNKYYVGGYFSRFDGIDVQPIFRLEAVYEDIEPITVDQTRLKISPNPAKDFINIEIPKHIHSGLLSIYSLDAKLQYSKQIRFGEIAVSVSTESWVNGVYNCILESEGTVASEKILVVH